MAIVIVAMKLVMPGFMVEESWQPEAGGESGSLPTIVPSERGAATLPLAAHGVNLGHGSKELWAWSQLQYLAATAPAVWSQWDGDSRQRLCQALLDSGAALATCTWTSWARHQRNLLKTAQQRLSGG